MKNARNAVIVLALAAAVLFLPGARTASDLAYALLSLAFAAGIAYLALRLYREHRSDIYGLGDRHRAILYVAIGVSVLALAATSRLWQTQAGTLAWVMLLAGSALALGSVYRSWRSY